MMIVMTMNVSHNPCLFPEKISLTPDQKTHCRLMTPGLKRHVMYYHGDTQDFCFEF